MPQYEFVCKSCNHQFEDIVPIKWEGKVSCPECSSKEIDKKMSVFAINANGASSSAATPSCASGGCSTGMCPYSS